MINKPNLTRVWASGAPGGNIEDPDVTSPGKFNAGWTAEIPPFENFNFLQQLCTQGLAHLNEQGIGVWDPLTTYPVGALTKGSDGNIYKSSLEQSSNDPVSDGGTNWNQSNEMSEYNPTYNYTPDRVVKGSDKDYYICLLNNGTDSSVVDPVGDVSGTWSFLLAPSITSAVSIEVGVDFPTITECLKWASKRRILDTGSLIINLATGSNPIGSYQFNHPDSEKISIVGKTMLGDIPDSDDMVGVYSTDLAFIKTRWASWLDVTADIGIKYGLSVSKGMLMKDFVVIPSIPFIAQSRYSIAVGEFSSSWQTHQGGSSLGIDNFGVFGGTWGIVAVNSNITNKSKAFFAYQDNGAPILLSGSRLQSDTNIVNSVDCYSEGGAAKYAIYAINGSQAMLDNSLKIKGAFSTGIYARGGSYVSASNSNIEGVETIATIERGSYVNLYSSDFIDCDTSPATAQQELWQGNSGVLGAQISVGQDCSVNYDHTTWNGCIGTRAIQGGQASDASGLTVTMDNCLWSSSIMTLSGCKGRISISVTNPQVGSSDLIQAAQGGYIYTQTSSGVTYSPALGTQDSFFSSVV